MSSNDRPQDWKNYDDFAAGIDTNRLPQSAALEGRSFDLRLADADTLRLAFAQGRLAWSDANGAGNDPCDVVEVAPHTYFVDVAFATRPTQASTLILNTATRRALSVTSTVRTAEEVRGEPRVGQVFRPGTIDNLEGALGPIVPAPTRDLIGLRAHFTYSPQHTYEHTYLSSERYCWQCLVGVQRGHGDVDLATTYRFDENQYVFTFREFLIPVASVFFYNFDTMRSTGKFLGITGGGQIENSRAGAIIRKASMTFYLPGQEPV